MVPPAHAARRDRSDAAFILALLREHGDGPIRSLLELGSGGGNVAYVRARTEQRGRR